MAIPFNPPEDLIRAYFNRPQPAEIANQGIASGIAAYAATRKQEEEQAQKNDELYIKAFEAGGPTLAAEYAKRRGMKNTPTLPGITKTTASPGGTAGVMSNQQSPPSMQPTPPIVPTSLEDQAQQSLPGEHIINHWNATMNQPQAPVASSSMTPPGLENPTDLLNQGNYGTKKLAAGEALGKYQDAMGTAEEKGPKSFDYARAFAKNAGVPNAADDFISIATKEGRNTLSKREMDDIKNSVAVAAQKDRGAAQATTATVKEQTLRDSLIKEARTSMDPYFQTGAGKDQADRLMAIGRVEPLITQMLGQKGGGDPHQMTEMATAFDRVLKGGGASAQANIEHLLPRTSGVTLANWKEWWTNNPQGTEQQGFIKRAADSINREKKAVQSQVRSTAERTAPTLRVLKSNYPDDYNAVIDQYLNHSPEIMGSATPQPVAAPALSPAAQAVLNKHRG